MRLWIDLANSPHVPFFKALAGKFTDQGHEIEITFIHPPHTRLYILIGINMTGQQVADKMIHHGIICK